MIVFGWRTRPTAVGRGTFLCPQCGVDRAYTHQRARRWFTLFFIPVIPLGTTGNEWLQCDTCRKNWKTSVLSTPTLGSLQNELLYAFREAVVILLRAGSTATAEGAALAGLQAFAGREWSAEELRNDLTQLDTGHLDGRLAWLAGALNEQGKERFVSTCAWICTNGGMADAAHRAVIERVGAGLLMTKAHVHGVLDQVLGSTGPASASGRPTDPGDRTGSAAG